MGAIQSIIIKYTQPAYLVVSKIIDNYMTTEKSILREYFKDLTDLFTKRFTEFSLSEKYSEKDYTKLLDLVIELGNIKKLLNAPC